MEAVNEIILYVEYDSGSAGPIIEALREATYEVIKVDNNTEAQEYVDIHDIDMLIVDQAIEMMDYTLIRRLQKRKRHFVSIILSHRLNTEDIVEGFNAGGNDYIVKPVPIEILLVRIQNLFHLTSNNGLEISLPLAIGELTIDLKSRKVTRDSQEIHLTPKEYELLLYLARHVNEVCSREEILKQVWKYDYSLGTNVVDVYVRHLRVKLDKGYHDKMIQTSRGVGYLLGGPT